MAARGFNLMQSTETGQCTVFWSVSVAFRISIPCAFETSNKHLTESETWDNRKRVSPSPLLHCQIVEYQHALMVQHQAVQSEMLRRKVFVRWNDHDWCTDWLWFMYSIYISRMFFHKNESRGKQTSDQVIKGGRQQLTASRQWCFCGNTMKNMKRRIENSIE